MTDHKETKSKRKNEKLLVEKAIPKIAKSLHSIIVQSKNKDFQHRCIQGAQVNHFDDLPEKFESKLWEIARLKMGIFRCTVEEDGSCANNQVVPRSPTNRNIHQKTVDPIITEQQVVKTIDPAHHKNAFDGLVPFQEIISDSYGTENLNSAYDEDTMPIKSVPTNNPVNNLSDSSKELIMTLPKPRNPPEVIYIDDDSKDLQIVSSINSDKDDWLDDFTQDSYWMNEASCDNSLQEMSVSFAQLDHGSINSRNLLSFGGESVGKSVVVDGLSCSDTTDLESDRTLHRNSDSDTCRTEHSRNFDTSGYSYSLETIRREMGNNSGNNFQCLDVQDNTQEDHDDWMSFQERNTLIDDFDALADFFDV